MDIDYTKTELTWWLDKLNKRFWLPDYKELIVLFWYMSSWKTEFSYFVARKNAEKWNPVCYISLELDEYSMKLRIARKRASINKYDYDVEITFVERWYKDKITATKEFEDYQRRCFNKLTK